MEREELNRRLEQQRKRLYTIINNNQQPIVHVQADAAIAINLQIEAILWIKDNKEKKNVD